MNIDENDEKWRWLKAAILLNEENESNERSMKEKWKWKKEIEMKKWQWQQWKPMILCDKWYSIHWKY